MFRLTQLGRTAITPRLNVIGPAARIPFQTFRRNYVIVHKDLSKAKKEPRIRYIAYIVAISWVAIWFVSGQVDKKKTKQYMSEREFQEYEQSTGIKRRHKLIGPDLNSKYKFYVLPYIHSEDQLQKIESSLKKADPSRKIVVLDPSELVAQEKADEGKRYSALINELDASHKPYPSGLITAILKHHLSFLMNTREGTFDTNYIIKNYPQTTSEAIKFENDVSDIAKCLVLNYDMENELPKHKNDEEVRSIKNVEGYFDSVGKTKTLTSKYDEMDAKFEEIMLEDF